MAAQHNEDGYLRISKEQPILINVKEQPMFNYNLWMGSLQPDTMSIILSSYQHCDEQQFQTLSCALYTIFQYESYI